MAGSEVVIRKQTARLVGVGSKGQGTLLLYPDKLVHVHSQAIRWGTSLGLIVVFAASFALAQGGPGALGALIGAGGGWMIGATIARSQAAAKAAAAGDGVTVIPLDSVTGMEARKSAGIGGRLGGQSLLVTTADGAEYGLGVKLDSWSADLTRALAARGHGVVPTAEGMAITPGLHA